MANNQILLPKLKSPVSADAGTLYRWDTSVRKYYAAFELEIAGLRQGISALNKNPFTAFRDPVQYGNRYQQL